MEKSELISTLNELAEISRDGEQGFWPRRKTFKIRR